MGIHKRKVQFNHYVCSQLAMESPHDTNRLRYIISGLTYMVLKSKILSSATPRNLTVETFVRIVSRICMCNAFFWLEIFIITSKISAHIIECKIFVPIKLSITINRATLTEFCCLRHTAVTLVVYFIFRIKDQLESFHNFREAKKH